MAGREAGIVMRPSAERPAAAAPPSHPILEATAVSKRFGGVLALDAVDFELRPGEIHALMGENGAGKSTLMKILSGVYTDYDGELTIDGRPVRFASVRDAEGAGIAIIHQELNLVPELSVADNIFLGRERLIAGLIVDRKASAAAARGLLKRLGIELDPEARVGALRVGEQQLVEIAKALSIEARILIMDEPTSALSPAECQRLFAIIRQLAADGVAVVYISHRIEEVMALADRVTVFRDGRHVMTRPMRRARRGPHHRRHGRPQPPRRAARGGASWRPAGALRFRPDARPARPQRLAPRAARASRFDLSAGEILGIGGLLGSGRTEILETIFGSAEGRRGGEIRLDGEAVDIRSPREARRLGLALVTEDRKTQGLHLRASIVDNVALPLVGRLARFGVRSFAGEAALARHAVEALGVRCGSIEQPAGTLSGGNQQKVVIGKWLATRPRVLLLDEPTRGIDVGAKREIYDLVFRLARDGLAIVAVSSEMPELLLLADRILVHVGGPADGHAVARRGERGAHHAARRAAPPPCRAAGGMSALALISRTKLYWGLVAIFLIGVLSSPVSSKGNNIFLSYGNLLDVLRQVSTTGLIATGMTAVIITGGIDLSVGSLMAICSVVTAMLLTVPGDTPAVYMGIPAVGARRAGGGHRADPLRVGEPGEEPRRRTPTAREARPGAFARPDPADRGRRRARRTGAGLPAAADPDQVRGARACSWSRLASACFSAPSTG